MAMVYDFLELTEIKQVKETKGRCKVKVSLSTDNMIVYV